MLQQASRPALIALAAMFGIAGGGITSTGALAQTFNGSFANPVTGKTDTATAAFSVLTVGASTYLNVTLTNTSTFSDYGNNDLLNGVFWAIAGSPSLTPASATTGTIMNPSQCSAGMVATCSAATVNVGGEYGYQFSAAGYSGALNTTAQYGIGASGYSLLSPNFGAGQTSYFGASPPNLAGPSANVGGPDFSIVGPSYNAGASSGGAASNPLLNTSVTFGFLLPSGVTSLSISNVTFAYGTNPDGSVGGTLAPEPATIAMFSVGAIALVGLRRRRSRVSIHLRPVS